MSDNRLEDGLRQALIQCSSVEFDRKSIIQALGGRRLEKIQEKYHRLSDAEPRFMEVVDVDVNWSNLRVEFHWVETKFEVKVWNYARMIVSSGPDFGVIGRRMRFYFCDGLTGRWLGIGELSSALTHPSPRHRHMGMIEFGEKLNKVLNLSVCIGIQPFGLLCGGKLLFVVTLSNEVIGHYKHMYGDDLLAVETTSLYGKSSQYNRVKEFSYIGLTKGYTPLHVPQETIDQMHRFIRLHPEHNWYVGGTNSKMRNLQKLIRILGLNADEVLMKHKRGYYWGVTAENSEAILKNENGSEPRYYDRPLQNLIDWWRHRWYEMRLPKKQKEIAGFDAVEEYALDNNVPLECQQSRQMFLF